MTTTASDVDTQQAVPWFPIPEAANHAAFLDVVRLEGNISELHLTVTVASRFPADHASGRSTAAWHWCFRGVVRVEVEPAYLTQELSIPLPDNRSATWKVAPSRVLKGLEEKPLPGMVGATLEHFAIRTLHSRLYQIIAMSCTCTALTGEEAEIALRTYEQGVDGLLALARR